MNRRLRAVAAILTVINVLGLGYALVMGEWPHAAVHGVLVMAFGSWSRQLARESARALPQDADRLEALEDEVGHLQGELSDAQDRLDFAERMLAQQIESRRTPER